MKWIRRKIANWLREDELSTTISDLTRNNINSKSSIRFTIYPASGGFVIEHIKQDRYKDSEGPELTIVNNGEDLGKTVEHIIAIESLRS